MSVEDRIMQERINAALASGRGYCTDCDSIVPLPLREGRCGCGSGRVMTAESVQRAQEYERCKSEATT